MADLKTTNIYGDAYINNKVGIATNAPATRLQIGQLSPTAATEGIQFGDDTGARLHRINTGHIRATGGFSSATFVIADNYLQTNNNLIYPASQTATQRLEVGNASGNAWVDGLTIAQGGNVTVYNNLTVNNAATVTNDLTVNGNTYLGNAGGDTVFVNDIIRIGATDSGDASLFFGEGSVAGSDYGARWYWDSGYTFTWYTRNNGTDTQLFNYVTNDLSYVNWNRNFNMQNYSINYNAQIHFNAGTRFVGQDTSILIFRSDSTSSGGIRVQDGSVTTKGYIGYWDSGGGGILNNTGNWAVRYNFGSANSGGSLYGTWVVESTNDGILTLNKSSGTGWGYINFSQAGTRRFYFGLNGSFEPELGVDNGGTFRVVGGMTVAGNAVLTSTSTLTAGNLSGTIPSGVLGNSTLYVGTTAIALNRASAGQTLTGISIDGNAANITAYTINQSVGTANSPTFVGLSLTSVSTTGATITNLTGAYQNTTVYDSPRTQSATPSRGIRAPASSIQFTDSYAIAPYYTYRSTGDWPVPYGIGWGTGGESSGIFQRYASNGYSFGDMIFYTGNDGSGAFSFRRHTWEGTTYFAQGSGELNTELFRIDWSGNLTMLGTLNGSANSATLYPNNGAYGSWKIGGTRGGWYGIEFESGTILMANSSESGFYRNGVGWQMWWSGGTGYVQKGGSGGGTQATILESSNYTSYTPGLGTNNTLTGINTINNTSNTVINTLSGNLGLTMFQATAGTDAYMTFHIGGDYAAYFGLGGAENDLVYGGWSVGNVRYRILHSGNATYAWNMNQYVRTTDNPTFNSVLITSEISISKNNPRNLLIQGSGGADSGLLGRGSSGQFAFQLYGSGGGDYGFLDGAWAGWDIRKTVSGNLYLNNNNTYYLNPASTTNLLSLTVANTITGAVSGNAGTVTNGLYTTGGQTIAGITYFSNGESINAYGIRGRFTNEYLHLYSKVGVGHPGGWGQGETSTPTQGLSTYGGLNIAYGDNGISTFNGVIRANSNIRQGADLAMPLSSWSVSGTSTGMVIFSFPGNTGNYGMVHCVFDIYEYNSNTVSTVIVGGHNYGGAWYNTGANVIGRCGKSVRLGVKDSKFCVVFGGAASSWDYGTIILRKIHNGGFYTGTMDMGGSFTTQQTATESFSNISGDLRALRTSADFIADGGISGTTFTGAGTGLTGTAASLNIGGNAATATGQQSAVHFTLNTGGAGYGLVGQYNPDVHQGLFAMGAAYTLGAGGTLGNLYGMSWSYDYSGRQLNTGYNLQHSLVIANAGSVYTVIGQGIWTSGLIRANGNISSGGTITATTFSGPLTGNASTATNVAWTGITSKPTTLSGFGITDAASINGASNQNFSANSIYPYEWIRFMSDSGIYWQSGTYAGFHIHPQALWGMSFRSAAATDCGLQLRRSDATSLGAVYADGTSIGFLTAAFGWGASFTVAGVMNRGSVPGSLVTGNISGNAATATALTSMNISQFTNNSGYLTSVTIANGSVTLAKIENITAYTILGNSSISAAATPAALSVATVATMLSGQTMNINGSSTSCSGNAASATTAATCTGNAATATTATTATNVGVGSGNTSAAWYPVVWHSGNTLYSTPSVILYAAGAYIQAAYFNSSDDDTGGITRFVVKNGDGYHRSATTTLAADTIRGVASGTWSITAATANALTTGNTYQVANLGIGVAASNRLHVDGGSPAAGTAGIRIDNAGYLTGVASNNKATFYGYLPLKVSATVTVYIRLWQ